MVYLGTFSIAARCAETGMLGAAVATAFPASGAFCPHVKAGVGVVCTQAGLNVNLGIDGLRMLEQGLGAAATLERLLEDDPDPHLRQLGIVDGDGGSIAHSGEGCVPWFGHVTGPELAVQGNMLTGEGTVAAMAESFDRSGGDDLPERLLNALEAGQRAGGDKRGRQSAAIYVAREEEWPYLSLRVDEDPEPVTELRRVFEVAKRQLIPFVDTLPTRSNPRGVHDEAVVRMNLSPPGERSAATSEGSGGS